MDDPQIEPGAAADGGFVDRAVAAFWGLGIGDAYGRPLEFERGDLVRSLPVDTRPGVFDWTDDTHMALYLADAVLAQPPGPLDDDTLGKAVADAFVRWRHDPKTPFTAPGGTCMAGVRSYEGSGDWRTAGVPHSDGCGAVMRIVPLVLAYRGDELDRAARVSAFVTHGHPNAPAAAAALCRLARAVLEAGRLSPAMVLAVADDAARRDPQAPMVAAALRAAVVLGGGDPEAWLEEGEIPEGDGGWRSPSAVGLAVAAALRWGSEPARAIDRAGRIDGDSDSVACLAGMLLGAAQGTAALPGDWIAALPERARIEELARRLARA